MNRFISSLLWFCSRCEDRRISSAEPKQSGKQLFEYGSVIFAGTLVSEEDNICLISRDSSCEELSFGRDGLRASVDATFGFAVGLWIGRRGIYVTPWFRKFVASLGYRGSGLCFQQFMLFTMYSSTPHAPQFTDPQSTKTSGNPLEHTEVLFYFGLTCDTMLPPRYTRISTRYHLSIQWGAEFGN